MVRVGSGSRTSCQRRLRACVFLVLLASLIVPVTSGGSAVALNEAAVACHAWSFIRGPFFDFGDDFYDVDGTSSSDVWAVGDAPDTSGEGIITHLNGQTWIDDPLPPLDEGYVGAIYGVDAVSPTQTWAVGQTVGSDTPWVVIERQGGNWALQSALTDSGFVDVAATSTTNAWIVGSGAAGAAMKHWDGLAWQNIAVPLPNGTTSSRLTGISAVASNDAWAVGTFSTGSGDRPLIVHWDGSHWTLSPVTDPAVGGLASVSGLSSNEAWAVGGQSAIHWNGTAWVSVTVPAAIGAASLRGVSIASPNRAMAVGDGFAMDWNGSAWTAAPVEHWNFPNDIVTLRGVWSGSSAEDGGLAVGNRTVIMSQCAEVDMSAQVTASTSQLSAGQTLELTASTAVLQATADATGVRLSIDMTSGTSILAVTLQDIEPPAGACSVSGAALTCSFPAIGWHTESEGSCRQGATFPADRTVQS